MIVYDKNTGDVIRSMPDDQDILTFFFHYPQEFKDNLASIMIENVPRDLKNYRVINAELIQKSNEEILEIKKYGKILTEEERLNIQLMPSQQEVQKAQTTMEILSLLQEVNAI